MEKHKSRQRLLFSWQQNAVLKSGESYIIQIAIYTHWYKEKIKAGQKGVPARSNPTNTFKDINTSAKRMRNTSRGYCGAFDSNPRNRNLVEKSPDIATSKEGKSNKR